MSDVVLHEAGIGPGAWVAPGALCLCNMRTPRVYSRHVCCVTPPAGCYDAPTLAALQAALLADMGAFADDNAACCLAEPLRDDARAALLRAETLRCDPARLGALMADHTAHDWRPLLPLLRCPVLSMYGEASGVFPPEGCAVVGELAPKGRNVPVAGAGHWMYLEQPENFARTVAAYVEMCS